jgi:general secretion pathway protein E
MDDDLRELIVSRAPVRRIKEVAQSRGTRSLRAAALDLVRSGETTLDEINRVTFVA